MPHLTSLDAHTSLKHLYVSCTWHIDFKLNSLIIHTMDLFLKYYAMIFLNTHTRLFLETSNCVKLIFLYITICVLKLKKSNCFRSIGIDTVDESISAAAFFCQTLHNRLTFC